MRFSLTKTELINYLSKQMGHYFPDELSERSSLGKVLPNAMERLAHCFNSIHLKYYNDDDGAVYNHLNSDHHAMFLYILSNQAGKQGELRLAEKSFYLNKVMHGIDAFYAVELPEVFLFVHPLGTILGKAKCGNYITFYQNVTIGSGIDGVYPEFGENCILFSKSSVIGDCKIGNNVSFGANAFLINGNVEDNSIVVGSFPDHKILPNRKNNKAAFFRSNS